MEDGVQKNVFFFPFSTVIQSKHEDKTEGEEATTTGKGTLLILSGCKKDVWAPEPRRDTVLDTLLPGGGGQQ